jgi:hypothetical protein
MPAYELKLNRETFPYDGEKGRIGFSGDVAEEAIRNKYIGKSVADLFKQGELRLLHFISHMVMKSL